ncbi:hypothetical protein GJ496_003057 [Pomphorhynchus laevis]|nr:hypothetical protein GJ496_003057 [Pomphorhynchus laevis]
MKTLYKIEFHNSQLIIPLIEDDCLANFKTDMQEGSTPTKVVISYCLRYLMSVNASTANIGILRYCVLTHTSMAGLQLLGMAMMACHTLNIPSPASLFRKIGKEQTVKSILRLLNYFTLYISKISHLHGQELKDETDIRLTFKRAKLLDQQYYSDISLKNNLHLGFQLASFNSPDLKTGQVVMAAFDNPILSDEVKRQIFAESKMVAHILMNQIDLDKCLSEYIELQKQMKFKGNFREDGKFMIAEGYRCITKPN